MKVLELKRILEEYEDDAEVFIMEQPNYPFECHVDGVISRLDIIHAGDDDEIGDELEDLSAEEKLAWYEKQQERKKENRDHPWRDRWSMGDQDLPDDDVFILSGSQIRYGSRFAWSNV